MPSASSRVAPAVDEAPSSEPSELAGAPPGDEDRWRRLGALRAELDRLDDGLHDQLMRRAALVQQVRALGAKGRLPLRPGREASILRRLLGRNGGALAPATLVRVWREVLAGSSAQQHPMRVVTGSAGLAATVAEHFGALMPSTAMAPEAALALVGRGEAEVAVLPVDGGWWTGLGEGLFIVAKLPFWSRPGAAEAFVVSAAAPDPSGWDRSLIACADPAALTGFAVGAVRTHGGRVLADVDGFVLADDKRLRGVAARVLGAYAAQVGE